MNKFKISLIILCISLASCSVLPKSKPVEYYTLNQIKNSCLNIKEVSASKFLFNKNIILRREEHRIGSLPGHYWFTPINEMLKDIASVKSSNLDAKIFIKDLHYRVEEQSLYFDAELTTCTNNNCKSIEKNIQILTQNKEPVEIIRAYQQAFEKLISDVCYENSSLH